MGRPNIVLVVMDTARAMDVDESVMPNLHRIAEEGTRYTSAFANAPWTLPSFGTLFSGRMPSVHGAHALNKSFEFGPTLAERLNEAGYGTYAVSNNTWISGEFGFDRGFDQFLCTWKLFQSGVDFGEVARSRHGAINQLRGVIQKAGKNPVKDLANLVYGKYFRKRVDDGAKRTNEIVERRIGGWKEGAPFFLFINYLEPHLEYRPPVEHVERYLPDGVAKEEAKEVNQDAWAYITGQEEMDDRDFRILRALYRAELSYLDERLGELRSGLADAGVLEDTVFIVTSDHGENIGDHGLMDHQYCLFDTLLRVPLVIAGPGFEGGTTEEEPVQLMDLYPTILDIAEADRDPESSGESLIRPEGFDGRTTFAEYAGPQPDMDVLDERYDCSRDVEAFERSLRAVRKDNYVYVQGSDDEEWLFDWCSDPNQERNIIGEEVETAEELRDVLDRYSQKYEFESGEREIGGETQRRLEELGYLQ